MYAMMTSVLLPLSPDEPLSTSGHAAAEEQASRLMASKLAVCTIGK